MAARLQNAVVNWTLLTSREAREESSLTMSVNSVHSSSWRVRMLQERIISRVVCDVGIDIESRQEGGMAASWRERFC